MIEKLLGRAISNCETFKNSANYLKAPKMSEEFRHIFRIAGVDLDGRKKVGLAIKKIRGVSTSFANAVVRSSDLENKVLGKLSDSEVARLEDTILHPEKHKIPFWLYNRRKDYETGMDKHLVASDLVYAEREDIDSMKKMRSRRGIRHSLGLRVRGQRTRSTGRKGAIVGVTRKAVEARKGESSGRPKKS